MSLIAGWDLDKLKGMLLLAFTSSGFHGGCRHGRQNEDCDRFNDESEHLNRSPTGEPAIGTREAARAGQINTEPGFAGATPDIPSVGSNRTQRTKAGNSTGESQEQIL